MDTELLKTFLEVEKMRHFGRAADNLCLTHAAVSARIRQLEGLIGSPLFTRHRNNVGLTAAGERLKPHAHTILDTWCRAMQESALAADDGGGPLAIGGTPNLWDALLEKCLHRLRSSYPAVALCAEMHGSEYLTARLLGRQLDLAVLFEPPKLEGVVRHRLRELAFVLVATAPGRERESAVSEDYVQISWSPGFDLQHTTLFRGRHRPALFTSSGRIALDYVLLHGGALFLPETVARPLLAGRRLHRVPDAPEIRQAVYVSYLKDSPREPLLQELAAQLQCEARHPDS
jgi:DNA-binding transcriptional LysR family regulator